VLLYGGLGYLFASQWERVGHTLSIFSGLSFGLFFLVQDANVQVKRFKNHKGQMEGIL